MLVKPHADSRTDLADRYRLALSPNPYLMVWPIGQDVIERAASLRAKYRIKMLDAIHVASAVVNQADFFVTNDEGLRRIVEVPILILADYLAPPSGSVPSVAP